MVKYIKNEIKNLVDGVIDDDPKVTVVLLSNIEFEHFMKDCNLTYIHKKGEKKVTYRGNAIYTKGGS